MNLSLFRHPQKKTSSPLTLPKRVLHGDLLRLLLAERKSCTHRLKNSAHQLDFCLSSLFSNVMPTTSVPPAGNSASADPHPAGHLLPSRRRLSRSPPLDCLIRTQNRNSSERNCLSDALDLGLLLCCLRNLEDRPQEQPGARTSDLNPCTLSVLYSVLPSNSCLQRQAYSATSSTVTPAAAAPTWPMAYGRISISISSISISSMSISPREDRPG